MPTPTLVDPKKTFLVRLKRDDRWLRLRFHLTRPYTGGELVQFAENAFDHLQGACELASTYRSANWASGIASGAFYAFRALDLVRQHVFVSELSGQIRADEMVILAYATAMEIATLAEKPLPLELRDGWTLENPMDGENETSKPVTAQGAFLSEPPTPSSKLSTPA